MFVLMGLLAAPAAWAGQGPARAEEGAFLVGIDQWIDNVLAEVAGWFGLDTQVAESTDGGTGKITDDPEGPTPTPDGGGTGGNTGGTTDAGANPDPNGG